MCSRHWKGLWTLACTGSTDEGWSTSSVMGKFLRWRFVTTLETRSRERGLWPDKGITTGGEVTEPLLSKKWPRVGWDGTNPRVRIAFENTKMYIHSITLHKSNLSRGHGMKHTLKFGGCVTAENRIWWNIILLWKQNGTKYEIWWNCAERLAERPPSVNTKRGKNSYSTESWR